MIRRQSRKQIDKTTESQTRQHHGAKSSSERAGVITAAKDHEYSSGQAQGWSVATAECFLLP